MVQDCGGTLSIVMAGHPKLKNDLRRSSLEEIGSRTTVFDLDGITAGKRDFIEWLIQKCTKSETDIHSILTEEAVDLLLVERLHTPCKLNITLGASRRADLGMSRKLLCKKIYVTLFTYFRMSPKFPLFADKIRQDIQGRKNFSACFFGINSDIILFLKLNNNFHRIKRVCPQGRVRTEKW